MLTTHKWWCTGFVTRNRISSILIVSSKSWHIPAQPDKLENCSGMLKTWVRIPLCQQKNNPIAQLVQSNSLTWNRSSVRTRLGLQISSLAQRKSGCFTCNRSWVQSPQELQKYGIVSEWSKDAVCKTVMISFIIVGSNPTYASKICFSSSTGQSTTLVMWMLLVRIQ